MDDVRRLETSPSIPSKYLPRYCPGHAASLHHRLPRRLRLLELDLVDRRPSSPSLRSSLFIGIVFYTLMYGRRVTEAKLLERARPTRTVKRWTPCPLPARRSTTFETLSEDGRTWDRAGPSH